MKFLAISFVAVCNVLPLLLLVLDAPHIANAAAIICGDDSTPSKSQVAPSTSSSSSSSPTIAPTSAASEKSAVTTEPAIAIATSTSTEASDVKQFFHTVQCTLEKARPWVEELEKEAKRLEETAKRFGEGVIRTLGGLMDRLFTPDSGASGAGGATSLFGTIIGGGNGVKLDAVGSDVVTGQHDNDSEQESSNESGNDNVTTNVPSSSMATEVPNNANNGDNADEIMDNEIMSSLDGH